MDSETRQKIEAAVIEILEGANMEESTEFKVRTMAAEKLGLDLSLPDTKRFVRQVVENFLQSKKDEETSQNQDQDKKQEEEKVEKEEEEEEEEGKKKSGLKEYDDEGDLIICRLSNKRRVTLQEFKGKTLVSIREYYEKDGKQLPSSKGFLHDAVKGDAFAILAVVLALLEACRFIFGESASIKM